MNKYIVSIFLLIFVNILQAQDAIKILSYDYSNYPIIKNKLFVFDNNGIPVLNLNTGNIAVRDNGLVQSKIHSFNCISSDIHDSNSITIVFDLGLDNSFHNPTNFDLGKQIASRILAVSDSLKTEISLSSFDYRSFLNRDFTFSYHKIIQEINSYKAAKGSLFDAAFLSEPAGAFKINSRAVHNKSIILITDGGGKYDENALSQKIAESGAKVYVISLRKGIPQTLESIVQSSGGWNFEINNTSQINSVVYSVLAMSKGYIPCELSWEMDYTCVDSHFVEILVPSKTLNDGFNFVFNSFAKSYLTSDPQFLGFSSVDVGTKKQLSLVVTAQNRDIFIKEMKINEPFKIIKGNVNNFILAKDNFIEITVEYTPTQQAIVFSQLDIISDACGTMPVYITGGFPNTKPTEKTVKILHPNGGEHLIIGDVSFVKWLGLLPKDVIQLEYSTDNGLTWKPLATNVTGLQRDWIVPDTPSDSCLVKIIQLWPNNVGFTMDLLHNADVNTAFFNNAGDLVLTASADTTAVVWVANTGVKKFTIRGHNKPIHWAVFDPLDKYLVTSSYDSTVKVWDVNNGSLVKDLGLFISKVESVNFSKSGQYLVTSDFAGYSTVFDRDFNEVKRVKSNEFGPSWYTEFNPVDEDYFITANGDGKAKVWKWKDYTPGSNPEKVFATESILCSHVTYNSDATKISATTSSGNPKKLYVWNASDNSKSSFDLRDTLYSISHNSDTSENNSINYSSFFYHPDLAKEVLLTTSTDETARLWDASDGTPARINDFITDNIFREHKNSVTTAVFDRFGTRLLTASWDSTAKIWNLNQKELQQDVSDSVFSIAYAKGSGPLIDMGTVFIDEIKDTIIPSVFINESDFAYNIINFKFSGLNAGDFELLTDLKLPVLIERNGRLPFEIRFKPKEVGFRTAEMEFELPAGVVVKTTINGICDSTSLRLDYKLYDFGKVRVGDFKDTTISMVMTNISGDVISLDSIKMVGSYRSEFTYQQSIGKQLAAGESIPVTFRLTPQSISRKNAQYEINYKGKGSPRWVNLFGEGIEGSADSLRIYIKDVEAFPGDIVKVPIYVGSVGQLGLSDFLQGFSTSLRFNKTLLEPLNGFTTSEIIGGERILGIDLPNTFSGDSILHTLEFKALWGNDTISPLTLEYSVPRGSGKINITENSAYFKLKGVCLTDGKLRLFMPGDGLNLSPVVPSPASFSAKLDFNLIENGITKISIFDVLGIERKLIVNEYLVRGQHSVEFDVSDLPNGKYFYLLKTHSDIVKKEFIINR